MNRYALILRTAREIHQKNQLKRIGRLQRQIERLTQEVIGYKRNPVVKPCQVGT